jgi:ribosome-associated toxin RatA of RatAB toxin-antitoxin module
MLKNIVLVLAIVLVAFFGYVATRPDTYRVERSAVVAAPPDVTFDLVNDFRRWDAWSPWDELDPDQKKTYSGPASGEGAVTEWSGDEKVGKGRMTITESVEDEKVVIDLEFKEPFESKSVTTFRFEPAGDEATKVSWAMEGQSGLMMKAMGLFTDFDAMVGKDFEKGLAALDEAAQAERSRQAEVEARAEPEVAAEATAAGAGASAEPDEAVAAPRSTDSGPAHE